MADKRETILDALFAALQTVTDDTGDAIAATERNATAPLAETDRPALRMWDGDEIPGNVGGRAITRGAPVVVTMQPAIFGYVKADQAAVGTAINLLLARVRKAVFTDAALASAIGSNGTVSQASLNTGLEAGKQVEGDFGLILEITYTFSPSEQGV